MDASKNRLNLMANRPLVEMGDAADRRWAGQPGFFDSDERLKALSSAGDPLDRLAQVVDFEVFRGDLEAALPRSDRGKGRRPPYDAVLMFKVLVLQTLYTLSDDQTEYQLKDRRSFMRFVGLALHDPSRTPRRSGCTASYWRGPARTERLFARFNERLRAKRWLAMGGQIIDATVIEARRPRLTQAENDTIKGGGVPSEWKPARRARSTATGAGPSSVAESAKPPPAPDSGLIRHSIPSRKITIIGASPKPKFVVSLLVRHLFL